MILTRDIVNQYRVALRRIEVEAHRAAEAACNGDRFFSGVFGWIDYRAGDEEREEAYDRSIIDRVHKAVRATEPIEGLFYNGDPRGYALKVKPQYAGDLHKDWGGYGIIAPETRD